MKLLKTSTKSLLLSFALLSFLTTGLLAQPCSSQAQFTVRVVGNDLVFIAEMPNIPNTFYQWGYDNGTTQYESSASTSTTILTVPISIFSSSTPTYVRLYVRIDDYWVYECAHEV